MGRPFFLFLVSLLPVLAAVVVYRLDKLNPVPYPVQEVRRQVLFPKQNNRMLDGVEKIGEGILRGPEDVAYDPKTGVIYTGCEDGWISRVTLNDSAAVEKWVNTGGRPLGIAHGSAGELLVADAFKGLLNITKDGVITVLTDEAEGVKFKLTDALDIGPDGTVYFTDASYAYSLNEADADFLEGRPNGRFMSYNPTTKETKVLVKDLHFANGVAVSADGTFVIFCETAMVRCKRYYIKGPRKGSVDVFIDGLPGLPDNIRYDGEGHYWIALNVKADNLWFLMQKYPVLRKIAGIVFKNGAWVALMKGGGVISVDLDGKPDEYYHDPDAYLITSSIKIGDHLYWGTIAHPYIARLNLRRHPAV